MDCYQVVVNARSVQDGISALDRNYRVVLYARNDFEAIRRAEAAVYGFVSPDFEGIGLVMSHKDYQRLENSTIGLKDADLIVFRKGEA